MGSKYIGTTQQIYQRPLTEEEYEGDARVVEVLNVIPYTGELVVVTAMVVFEGETREVHRKFVAAI